MLGIFKFRIYYSHTNLYMYNLSEIQFSTLFCFFVHVCHNGVIWWCHLPILLFSATIFMTSYKTSIKAYNTLSEITLLNWSDWPAVLERLSPWWLHAYGWTAQAICHVTWQCQKTQHQHTVLLTLLVHYRIELNHRLLFSQKWDGNSI